MKKFIYYVVRENAYLILTAVWLFTIAFIIHNYWATFNSTRFLKNSIERYVREQEKDFESLIKQTSLLQRLSNRDYTQIELKKIIDKPYGVFIYEADVYGLITLKFWNNQFVVPTSEILKGYKRNDFITLSSGQYEYVYRHIDLGNEKKLVVIALIPIHKQYAIENATGLRKEFVDHEQAEDRIMISQQKGDYSVKSSYGNILFYVHPKLLFKHHNANWVSLTLALVGIVFILLFINNLALYIATRFSYLKGFVFLFCIIILLRTLSYLFPGVLNLHQFKLFDVTIYSSGYVLNSLGDLLINSFLFCWIILFVRHLTNKISFVSLKKTYWNWPAFTGSALLLVSATFLGANIIQSLVADSKIPFNVTNFFSLDIYSFVGFLVLANISFAYFFLSKMILEFLNTLMEDNKYTLYFLIAIIGLAIVTILNKSQNTELNLYTLIWLLVYVWLMQQKVLSGFYYKLNISIVLLWLFVYSVSISIIIIYENQKIELQRRITVAEKLSNRADPSREHMLSIALMYFDNDFLYANFDRFKIPTANTYLKDSLSNKNFTPYLNKFDTKIYTFDQAEFPLYNSESVSYDTLNTIFQIQGKPTSVTDVRYFEKAFDRYSYISKKTVKDTANHTVGYFFILSDPKRYKNDALVPELFRQTNDLSMEYSPIYSYAIYNDFKLFEYYNNYMFPTHLNPGDIPSKEFTRVKKNGYDELWYKSGKDKVVIFAKEDNYIIEAITLFAWIFTTFLILVSAFRIILLFIQSRMRWNIIKQYWQLNIRSQIHGTIIFISLVSFFVIGIATIVFFKNRYKRNNQERLSKAIQIMSNDIQTKIQDKEVFSDRIRLYETGFNEKLEKLLIDVAQIHGEDINLYDLQGTLEVSSNPIIYTKGILSEKMNPQAFYYMNNKEMVQYINEEHMGDVEYQSIYSPIRDANGTAYAYLNIPSFVSQSELKSEISKFLITIINLNAFIFLVAGVISLFITNRITSSFILIGHKMREINLGKLNEEIAWNRDDEIGGLVKEYNKMVVKLGESALALAKSEREGAWREMARQVAHEIKNPLTPMKLSIQYLQKAIDNDSVNVKELSSNVARTLVEQIDHLSNIAADFSQFANIGHVRNEVFDLNEMLYSLSSLYESTENLEFKWVPLNLRILVLADKTQLNRLFTNLFQNAVEACEKRDACIVIVTEEVQADSVIIAITDNGDGIPANMRSKIFIPNFTTKSSGTGLGLAMSRTIVEQAKGDIWFKTVEGIGTTFFVKLPILRSTVHET
ncbi:MAG: HAMP domain-containing sensor histidine kinase [Chitinophagaceae bacterium]